MGYIILMPSSLLSNRFNNRQGFKMFVDGAGSLARFQKDENPAQLAQAIRSLEQSVQADPDSGLGRFYLGLAHSLNGPEGADRAREEFEAVVRSTSDVRLRLTDQCNLALLLGPSPGAEEQLNGVLKEVSAHKGDPDLARLGREVTSLLPELKNKTVAGPMRLDIDF